jgi:hypothetical protein
MGLPNGVFGDTGWVARGSGTTTTTVADPFLTLLSPPNLRDIGTQTDFKSFLGIEAANAFAINVDGVNESLTTPTNAAYDFNYNSTFSISAWVKTGSAGWKGILKKAPTSGVGGTFKGYTLGIYNGQLFCQLNSNWGIGEAMAAYTSGVTIHDNAWHQVAVTFDGTGTFAGTTMYIDGVATAAATWSYDNLGTNSIQNTEPLQIGVWAINGVGDAYWTGGLDEVSIWNKELDTDDIDEIYGIGNPIPLNVHGSAANLVGWWRMGDGDDGAGVMDSSDSSDASARVYDMSTNSNNLTPVNTEYDDIGPDVP